MDFLEKAEDKFHNMRPLGSDIDTVKEQIEQLKAFKADVDPQMVKVEALNRWESLLYILKFLLGKWQTGCWFKIIINVDILQVKFCVLT